MNITEQPCQDMPVAAFVYITHHRYESSSPPRDAAVRAYVITAITSIWYDLSRIIASRYIGSRRCATPKYGH